MSEESLEKALFHLYLHIHECDSSSELFQQFSLSREELAWLEKLIATGRQGLLTFNQQLRAKGHRYVKQSLPKSSSCFAAQLDAILECYSLTQTEVGPRDPASAVRAFSDFLERTDQCDKVDLRAFDLIRFESLFIAMALDETHSAETALAGSRDPGLWCLPPIRRCKSLTLNSDPTRCWESDAEIEPSIGSACHLLLFASNLRAVRVVRLSPSLHNLIDEMAKGRNVREALTVLDYQGYEERVLERFRSLLRLGLPFVIRATPAESV